MAARRNGRKRRRNRGRFGFLYKMLAVAAILAAILAGCVVFFRVDRIEVAGESKYTAQQIIGAAEVNRGDNLVTMDKFKMSKQILTRLPYVAQVSISRELPDTLVITVKECSAVAAVESGGAWWLLNSGGKYLERTDAAGAEGLPRVKGITLVAPMVGTRLEVPEEESVKREGLLGLFRALDERGMTAATQGFDFSAVNVILMGYGGRFTVKMPMSTDFDYQMKVTKAATERLPETSTGVLDLTREDNPHLIPYG